MNIIRPITDSLTSQQLKIVSHGIGLFVLSLIVCLGYFFNLTTTEDQLVSLQKDVSADRQLLELKDAIVRTQETAECELFAMTQRLDELTDMIPETPQESRFLAQLSQLAESASLEISDFRPGPVEDGEALKRIEVRLSGAGSYVCLCEFLHGLHSLPRLTHVSELAISTINEDGLYPISMSLAIFFAESKTPTKVAKR